MTMQRPGPFARPRSRGQALVEFALVAPLFFILLFGIIEAGRFIFYYETLSSATREGARYAIVNGANTLGCPSGPPAPGSSACDTAGNNVQTRVRQQAFGVSSSAITVQRCWWYTACDFGTHGDGDNARGATVTVTASYTYSALVPLVPLPSITVTAESSLVINN
jgi:Flp pilus assembly protein TadG